jgi:hypothetical protein
MVGRGVSFLGGGALKMVSRVVVFLGGGAPEMINETGFLVGGAADGRCKVTDGGLERLEVTAVASAGALATEVADAPADDTADDKLGGLASAGRTPRVGCRLQKAREWAGVAAACSSRASQGPHLLESGAGEPSLLETGAGEPNLLAVGAGEPSLLEMGAGEPSLGAGRPSLVTRGAGEPSLVPGGAGAPGVVAGGPVWDDRLHGQGADRTQSGAGVLFTDYEGTGAQDWLVGEMQDPDWPDGGMRGAGLANSTRRVAESPAGQAQRPKKLAGLIKLWEERTTGHGIDNSESSGGQTPPLFALVGERGKKCPSEKSFF